MSDVIVDSSVLAKCVLREEDSRQAQRLFADMMAAGERVHGLDLALVEVVNAILEALSPRNDLPGGGASICAVPSGQSSPDSSVGFVD